MGLQARALEGGGKAFRLGEFVQPLLVEQNVDDFDPRQAPADLQAKKRANSGVAKFHVDFDRSGLRPTAPPTLPTTA